MDRLAKYSGTMIFKIDEIDVTLKPKVKDVAELMSSTDKPEQDIERKMNKFIELIKRDNQWTDDQIEGFVIRNWLALFEELCIELHLSTREQLDENRKKLSTLNMDERKSLVMTR